MKYALEEAQRAVRKGEPPFGAVVVRADGMILAAGCDTVRSQRDWTRHAEIETVRAACRDHGSELRGCTLVTTVEPCPMCFTSAWLARISRLLFGATMAEISVATGGAQRELAVPAAQMNALSSEPIELTGSILRDECIALFEHFLPASAA